jgi:hypothetical protein
MPLYWARFQNHGGHLFRIDTRVYLTDVAECREDDCPVGAVVAKNPGSARPSDATSIALHPISLKNDRLIPTVRSFVRRAYEEAEIEIPSRGYIQVLNLFYLCEKEYSEAIRKLRSIASPPLDPAEEGRFPWIMYLWGKYDRSKASHMTRFSRIESDHHFYFDQNLERIVQGVPGPTAFARHTQGMELEPVITYLAALIGSGSETA